MGNEVKTRFTGDPQPIFRSIDQVRKDIARYERDRAKMEQDLTRLIERQAEQRSRAEVRSFQQSLRAAIDYHRQVERLQRDYDAQRARAYSQFFRVPGAGLVSSAAGAFGIGLGAAGAVALTQQAIDKATEQARAYRLLSASATEAGQAQSFLIQKNKEFAASTAQSITAAAETTAKITQLATFSGDASQQNIDRLLKAFADLGAARGLQGNDLQTVIGSILSGSDEGLNRIGLPDPSKIYESYAKSIGKTTEELSQFEKTQSLANAVLEKAAVFSGAAEARMNSLEGSVAKASAQWENFTTNLATGLTRSYEFNALLDKLNQILGGMNKEVESLAEKAAKGINIDIEVQALAKDSGTVAFLKHLGIGILSSAGGLGYVLSPLDRPLGTRFGEASQNLFNAATDLTPQYQQQYQEQFLRNQINNEVKSNQFQNQASFEQRIKKLDDDIARFRAERLEREDAQKKAAHEAEMKRLEEQKKKIEEINQAKQSLVDSAVGREGQNNPFLSFLANANREMRQLLETAKALPPAMREAFVAEAQRQNRNQLFGLRLDAQIDATSLRNRAAEFRQGFNNDLSDPATVQRLVNQLFGTLGLPSFSNVGASQFYNVAGSGFVGFGDKLFTSGGQIDFSSGSGLFRPPNRTREEQAIIDQRLIREAGNYDPSLLNPGQRGTLASAFEREADRKLQNEKNANDYFVKMAQIIDEKNGLKVSVSQGSQVELILEDKSSSNAAIGATEGAVKARYK